MLENLDKLPWSKLHHAYGAAKDVPRHLRNLTSPKKDIRDKALWELYGNIFHQGTRYQATPYAIPFLYELIASPAVADRHELVYLLVNLALGYEEEYLSDGLDVAAFRRELEASDAQMSRADRAECNKYCFGPRVDLDCYDAVQNGVPILLPLLTDEDVLLRRAVIYALAWFPDYAEQSLPALQNQLTASVDEIESANLLLSLGFLARCSQQIIDEGVWRDFLQHPSLLVRVAAALGFAREPLTEPILAILIQAIAATEQLQDQGEDIRFNEGNLAGYASLVLAHGGAQARSQIVPALCEALKSVNPYQSLDITRALLDLITEEGTIQLKDSLPLDSLTRSALQAIAEFGGWKVAGGIFVNYCQLVRSYGLPDTPEALTALLAQATT